MAHVYTVDVREREPVDLTDYSFEEFISFLFAREIVQMNCGLPNLLDDSTLSFEARERCIRATANLFERLFANEALDTSVHMWWDSLCYDWHCGNRNRERGGEDKRLQDVHFETLAQILSVDSEICQEAALHGLGHLHHPDTPALIDLYIEKHSRLTQKCNTPWPRPSLRSCKCIFN